MLHRNKTNGVAAQEAVIESTAAGQKRKQLQARRAEEGRREACLPGSNETEAGDLGLTVLCLPRWTTEHLIAEPHLATISALSGSISKV